MDYLKKQKMVMMLEKNQLDEITQEELAWADGKEGRPAYVAVNGIVYNVTGYPAWEGGTHFNMSAGTDVTEGFRQCHNHTILERLEIIGRLVE